ncbi:MAG: DUF4012 domain-containing protein [Microthrixaceae bacterium]|nr:DUF4012 domain-containing protein [Microthrixaceae bacterium]
MTVGTPPATRARRYIWWGLSALAITVVLAGAWVGVRGFMAKSELESLAGLSSDLRSTLAAQDQHAAMPLIEQIGEHAARASALTGDPVWAAAEYIPWVGPNLRMARVTATQLDAIMRESAPPVLTALETLEGGVSDDGRLDLSGVPALAPELRHAAATLDRASAALGALDEQAVLPQLANGMRELRDAIDTAHPAVDALARASVLLPALLGSDEPVSILVLAQNNAELRTGGGITGTFIEMQVHDGHITVVAQSDSSDFDVKSAPIVPIPESTTTLYGDSVGRWVQNASMTPDFELTAEIALARWHELTGRTPEVVVSVDPLVLGAVLRAVGPVTLEGSELHADNLVQRLLVDPYVQLDSKQQSVLFQQAVTAVFDRVSTAGFDPLALAEQLATPVEEGRISVWSSNPEVQAAIAGTALAGPAARQHSAGDSAFAVYFNDATGGKMDIYLDVAITAGIESCRADGLAEVVVDVRLTSNAPADAGSALPPSVTGGGMWGTGTGDIGTLITVSAPAGYFFGGVINEGKAVRPGDVIESGFPSSTTRINLSPGQSESAQFRFIAPQPGSADPVILHTPLLTQPEVALMPSGCR